MTKIATMLLVIQSVLAGTFDDRTMPGDYWRNPLRCGPNCLYAYLSLHGAKVPLKTISERLPIGAKGVNMADLRRVASELGVPSYVVPTTPNRLGGFALPAIAHLQTREGHFVLVLRITKDTVTTADMLSGFVENLAADRFFERWSGYLLVPGTAPLPVSALVLVVALALGAIVISYWRRPSRLLGSATK
jgi:ABC-type bacteriocin/lantibiotic exporter with double-glycine peptidase domain